MLHMKFVHIVFVFKIIISYTSHSEQRKTFVSNHGQTTGARKESWKRIDVHYLSVGRKALKQLTTGFENNNQSSDNVRNKTEQIKVFRGMSDISQSKQDRNGIKIPEFFTDGIFNIEAAKRTGILNKKPTPENSTEFINAYAVKRVRREHAKTSKLSKTTEVHEHSIRGSEHNFQESYTTPKLTRDRMTVDNSKMHRRKDGNASSSKTSNDANPNVSQKNNQTCNLIVNEKSRDWIINTVLKYKYNFMHLHLKFSGLKVGETDQVIDSTHWVWTFDGTKGGHKLLYLPQDFGYLSFNILLSEASPTMITVYFDRESGNCNNFTIGSKDTDYAIAYALGNMTDRVAQTHDEYNRSYWCYNQRVHLTSRFLFRACENSICTFQTFGYRCCKFNHDYITMNRSIKCNTEPYQFGFVWWVLPIIIGNLLFAFYPLALASIGSRISQTPNSSQPETGHNMVNFSLQNETEQRKRKTQYVYLTHSYPVSFVSVLVSPMIRRCKFNGPVVSRLLRTLIILLPMSLSAIRVCNDYVYARRLIKDAVSKGGLVGFSSVIAGPTESMKHFLFVLGGPYSALLLYTFFGSIFILVPRDLQAVLVKGLYKGSGQQRFVVLTPMSLKEKFSRVVIHKHTGFKKIYKYLLANLYMVMNARFWCHSIGLLVNRWYLMVGSCGDNICIKLMYVILIFPVCFVLSTTELVFAGLVYTFPVISGFFIFLNAYIQLTVGSNIFRGRSICMILFRICFLTVLFVAFTITWYMYSIIFFDGFWFISKLIMFTYAGIIAYPKLSYGYMILTLMAIYYLLDSVHTFGAAYRDLLKLSVDVWVNECFPHKRREKSSYHRKIPLKLFEVIIERCRPKRIQVFFTIFKAVSIVLILCVSIDLLITFDKFQEISLVSHVFTVLFICALPKILNKMCYDKRRRYNRKQLKKKIRSIVYVYLEYGNEPYEENEESVSFSLRSGYEEIDVECD